eukprot:m.14795 g.14795  ORF g.14795 m.14795 type:complete len:445 (+) comp7229_c1_seq1:2206-3540(+)
MSSPPSSSPSSPVATAPPATSAAAAAPASSIPAWLHADKLPSPLRWPLHLLFDTQYAWITAVLLLLFELLLNIFIVHRVPYTEIDWRAYMQEVEGALGGNYDYTQLKGDTGPLVYPAGFVYFFALLHRITDNGNDIFLAQHIFIVFYLINLALVFSIYCRSKMPPYLMVILSCMSYRVHSIFVLRLFNDPIAMMFFFMAVNLFLSKRWTLGCLIYSFAVSIKMNVILSAPALAIVLVGQLGLASAILHIVLCGLLQVALGMPFLMENAWGYISRSFDLSRQFFYIWTVNWKILPEDLFLNRTFHLALLAMHVVLLLVFASQWTRSEGGIAAFVTKVLQGQRSSRLPAIRLTYLLFSCNFIGLCVARSLHYQFYVWYFHTLPFLLWQTTLPVVLRLAILAGLEVAWNTYPATPFSSGLLHACHLLLLAGLLFYHRPIPAKKERAD